MTFPQPMMVVPGLVLLAQNGHRSIFLVIYLYDTEICIFLSCTYSVASCDVKVSAELLPPHAFMLVKIPVTFNVSTFTLALSCSTNALLTNV